MSYFKNIESMEQLRKLYKKLAFELHPDRGGDNDQFVDMQNEYEKLLNRVFTGNSSINTEDDLMDDLKKVYENICYFPDIIIDLVGSWIWVSGNTKEVKDQLKENGFKWSGKKGMWYYHTGEYKKRSKKKFSYEEIKSMHGSRNLKKNTIKSLF